MADLKTLLLDRVQQLRTMAEEIEHEVNAGRYVSATSRMADLEQRSHTAFNIAYDLAFPKSTTMSGGAR